jgi:hypothetical protein
MTIAFRRAFQIFALFGLLSSGLASGVTFYANSLSSSGTPNMDNRLFRNGAQSTCNASKAFPGISGGANFAWQQRDYTNPGPAQCVTFTVRADCSGNVAANQTGVFLAGYGGVFDPGNLATGYLGDTGASPIPGVPGAMQLNLAVGQTVNLVIMAVNDDATVPALVCTYSIDDNMTPLIPATSATGLMIIALGLSGFACAYLRRRTAGRRQS